MDVNPPLTTWRTPETAKEAKYEQRLNIGRNCACDVKYNEQCKSNAVDRITAVFFGERCEDQGSGSEAQKKCRDSQGGNYA